MKKLFLFLSLISFFLITGFSQFSINMIQEMDVYDGKTASVSVVHSDGFIYNFQSSSTNIYVMKVSATNFAPTTTKIKITPGTNTITLKGAFEDPEGNIILFGTERSGISYGLIYKLSPVTMTIVNSTRVSVGSINYGCWGERMNSSNVWERAYAFITSNGRILISNDQLTLNANQYYIQNAIATQISWLDNSKMFVCSGYTTTYNNVTNNLPFLIIFDCKASYPSGWYNYFKFVIEDSNVKINSGIVAHTIVDDSNILLSQSFNYQNSNISYLQHFDIGVLLTPPYLGSILWNKRVSNGQGTMSLLDMKKNPITNQITLLGRFSSINAYPNDYIKNRIYSMQVSNNDLISTCFSINDEYLDLNSLYFNPFDETNIPMLIATGRYKSYDGVYRVASILYEHYNYMTDCQTTLSQKRVNLTTTLGIITDTYISSPICFNPGPQINPLNFYGTKGLCGEYHSGLPVKENEKSILIKQETTITLFESQEFLLQGFKGSVFCNIYDMTGKMVYSVTSENDMNNSIPTLSKGIYILKAVDNYGNSKTTKFFKD